MDIKVEIKRIYGKDLIYPVCEKAKLFASLIGQKTLGEISEYNYANTSVPPHIKSIKKLGYSVEVVRTKTL